MTATIYSTLITYKRLDGSQGSAITVDEATKPTIDHYMKMGYLIVEVDRRGYCGRCRGTGSIQIRKLRTCPECKGKAEWGANNT